VLNSLPEVYCDENYQPLLYVVKFLINSRRFSVVIVDCVFVVFEINSVSFAVRTPLPFKGANPEGSEDGGFDVAAAGASRLLREAGAVHAEARRRLFHRLQSIDQELLRCAQLRRRSARCRTPPDGRSANVGQTHQARRTSR
jgi:hypothetical protein